MAFLPVVGCISVVVRWWLAYGAKYDHFKSLTGGGEDCQATQQDGTKTGLKYGYLVDLCDGQFRRNLPFFQMESDPKKTRELKPAPKPLKKRSKTLTPAEAGLLFLYLGNGILGSAIQLTAQGMPVNGASEQNSCQLC